MHDVYGIIEQLKKLTRQAQSIAKLLSAYTKNVDAPVDNAHLMEKQCENIDKHVQVLPEGKMRNRLQQWLAAERKRIADNKEEFKIQFGQKLQALFKEKDISIKGQYPLLRISFYTLKLDFEFGQASLFFGPEIEEIINRLPLHPQAIFDAVLDYDQQLHTLEHSPDEYLEDMYQAYNRSLRVHDKVFGEKMLISDVLREFVVLQQNKKFFIDTRKNNFKEFPRTKLAYIFYTIKQSGATKHSLRFHVATFDATTSKLHSFWIPENEHGEGTHYSHISFEKQDCQDS